MPDDMTMLPGGMMTEDMTIGTDIEIVMTITEAGIATDEAHLHITGDALLVLIAEIVSISCKI